MANLHDNLKTMTFHMAKLKDSQEHIVFPSKYGLSDCYLDKYFHQCINICSLTLQNNIYHLLDLSSTQSCTCLKQAHFKKSFRWPKPFHVQKMTTSGQTSKQIEILDACENRVAARCLIDSSLIFFRNGENVEGATHKHVVNLIKKGGDKLTLVVISVSHNEAEKLDSESSSGEYYDYSERHVIPISIPETRQVTSDGETYVVRNTLS